jgi:hypothetical protein
MGGQMVALFEQYFSVNFNFAGLWRIPTGVVYMRAAIANTPTNDRHYYAGTQRMIMTRPDSNQRVNISTSSLKCILTEL